MTYTTENPLVGPPLASGSRTLTLISHPRTRCGIPFPTARLEQEELWIPTQKARVPLGTYPRFGMLRQSSCSDPMDEPPEQDLDELSKSVPVYSPELSQFSSCSWQPAHLMTGPGFGPQSEHWNMFLCGPVVPGSTGSRGGA